MGGLTGATEIVLQYGMTQRQSTDESAPSTSKPSRDPALLIRAAAPEDVPVLLTLIRELAAYEGLSHRVTATEEALHRNLFGERPVAEALLALLEGRPAGYAVFFPIFSTFSGEPALFLEDIYV